MENVFRIKCTILVAMNWGADVLGLSGLSRGNVETYRFHVHVPVGYYLTLLRV